MLRIFRLWRRDLKIQGDLQAVEWVEQN